MSPILSSQAMPMHVARRRLLAGVLALVTACSGEGGTPTQPGTLTLLSATPAATAARGTGATFPLSIARGNGFAGDVTLSAESVPAGVTATFAPPTLTGSATASTLTLDVGGSALPGTYAITVRARGTGVAEQIVQVSLSVPTPAITLVAGSAQVSMVQGTAATVPINVTRTNGFAGTIDLAITGLPGGLAASFAPAAVLAGTTTSTLTLTALNNATIGTVNLIVTANGSGVTQQTASFNLTVSPGEQPSYSLTASPAALSVTAGQSAQVALGIARGGGFAGGVGFSVSGAPNGMTATFNPATATANSATLTLATTAAITAGTYNLIVRGNNASLPERTVNIGVTVNEAPGVVLSLAPASLSMPQSQSRQTVVTITRTGGLTGNVSLALEGAPNGVTAVFSPAPASGTSSTLTVTAAPNTVVGTYALIVRGTGAGTGNVTSTTQLTLTVSPASYTLSANPSTLSLPAGATTSTTVILTRDPGFSGVVALAITGLPAGVSASFTPVTTAGNSAELTIAASPGTLTGPYVTTIIGTSAGRPDEALPFTINVVPPVAGAGNVLWSFCDPTRVPRLFAYRNGTSGTWFAAVNDTPRDFVSTFSQPVGSIAYVYTDGVVTRTDVFSGTVAELQAQANQECIARPAATKSYSVFVGGMTGLDQTALSIGNAATLASPSQPIAQLVGVQSGPQDLFATRLETVITSTVTRTPNRMLLRRGVEAADGATLPSIEMAGSESFVPASSTVTIENALGQAVALSGLFVTAANGNGIATYAEAPSTNSIRQYFGLPTPLLLGSDLQGLKAVATGTGTVRTIQSYYRSVADRVITLGPELGIPTYTSTSIGGLITPRVRVPIAAEYANLFAATYTQNNVAVTVVATRRFFSTGATEFVLEVPDLASLSGFQSEYGLGQNINTQTTVTASGSSSTAGLPMNGLILRSASRVDARTF